MAESETYTDDWREIDPWWACYINTTACSLYTESDVTLDTDPFRGDWLQIEGWWGAFVDSSTHDQIDDHIAVIEDRWSNGMWGELDPWWEEYVDLQQEAISELEELFSEVDRRWEQSASRFESGPLGVDWTTNDPMAGPLWTRQEENWSQWLGHLIRTAPESFLDALFGESLPEKPDTVLREKLLTHPSKTNRYPDILAFQGGQGVSIEVKKGDEAYGKTLDTAELIERRYPREWTHLLLLPRRKQSALSETFEDQLEDASGGRPTIRAERSNDISVLYWEEVSSTIRSVLQETERLDPHWEASAYLFATLIEQKIAKFVPRPAVEQVARGSGVVRADSSLLLTSSDIEDQISYLRGTLEATTDE